MIKRTTQFAKTMRSRLTDAEAALWRQLRARRFSGFKFKRRQPIERFMVDIVCLKHRLVVEVDGSQHDALVDGERSQWLQDQGFQVLCFWNDEVLKREEDVLAAILGALRAIPSPQPFSRKGRGAKARLLE